MSARRAHHADITYPDIGMKRHADHGHLNGRKWNERVALRVLHLKHNEGRFATVYSTDTDFLAPSQTDLRHKSLTSEVSKYLWAAEHNIPAEFRFRTGPSF